MNHRDSRGICAASRGIWDQLSRRRGHVSLRLDKCFFRLIKVMFSIESRWVCGPFPQSSLDVGEEVLSVSSCTHEETEER